MPVFEQKLISPLAVRFTQEHIRTTFRDGRLLEESYGQIETRPGTGDYDLLLEAPFPNIEIIRWHVPRNGKEPRDKDHWFTLDNRRLYCLQRAAVAHWPRRVAAVVDLLYADPGAVWKKFDSSSRGQTVTIGHSARGPCLSRWDWIWEMPASCEGDEVALQAITDDDERGHVSELRDVQAEPSSLLDLALAGALDVPELGDLKSACGPEADLATASAADSSEEVKAEEVVPDLEKGAVGPKAEDEHQDLTNEALAEVERQLSAPGNRGFVWVTSWNEWYLPILGTLRSFIESHPDRFIVHPGRGRGYTVSLVDDSGRAEGRKAAKASSRASAASCAEGSRAAAPLPGGRRRPGRGGAPKKWVVAGGGA